MTQNLYYSVDFRNGILGRKIQEQMDVVFRHLHLLDLKLKLCRDLAQHLCRTLADIFTHDPSAILRCPHQMIFGVVDSMAGPLDRHATMLAQPRLRLPTAGGTFPPRPKGGASKFISSVEDEITLKSRCEFHG